MLNLHSVNALSHVGYCIVLVGYAEKKVAVGNNICLSARHEHCRQTDNCDYINPHYLIIKVQFRSHHNPCSWLLEVAEIHVVFMVQQVVHLCIKGVGRLCPCKASV